MYYDASYQELSSLEDLDLTDVVELNCTHNVLTKIVIPNIVFNNLVELICTGNKIEIFEALPPNLRTFKCSSNLLTALPTLPNKLQIFSCGHNKLTSLPTLPDTLCLLVCINNKLTSLPKLPAKLICLGCENNRLTELPKLPKTLKELSCEMNQLKILPDIPLECESLFCWANPCDWICGSDEITGYDNSYNVRLKQYNTKRTKLGLPLADDIPEDEEWDDVHEKYTLLQYEPGGDIFNECFDNINNLLSTN